VAQTGKLAGLGGAPSRIGSVSRVPIARLSHAKCEAAADIGSDQAIGHPALHRGDKFGAAAMHRDHHVRRQPLELGDRVIDIILRCRAEMKPAEDGVQFADPGHRHGGLYRVDQSDMAA